MLVLLAGVALLVADPVPAVSTQSLLAERIERKLQDTPFHLRDHALFVSFAPADNPRIAVSVIAAVTPPLAAVTTAQSAAASATTMALATDRMRMPMDESWHATAARGTGGAKDAR